MTCAATHALSPHLGRVGEPDAHESHELQRPGQPADDPQFPSEVRDAAMHDTKQEV